MNKIDETSEEDPLIINHSQRFLSSPPFYYSNLYSNRYGCDLAIPNGEGIGNIIVFSRLVEELSLSLGRPIRLLTAPIDPFVGVINEEYQFPIWKFNPFISEIINSDVIDPEIINKINLEQDNYCQFNHMIENICSAFGLRPRKLKPSLFLSYDEMKWGMEILSAIPRPIVCLHPSGKSSPSKNSPWFLDNWKKVIQHFEGYVSFIQIGKADFDKKNIGIYSIETTIRQAMALIWASDIFVGFDSSPAHIATAFDKPALILWDIIRKNPIEEPFQTGFGPASLLRWGYPQNRNIMLLGERDDEIVQLVNEFIYGQMELINRQNKLLSSPNYNKWMVSLLNKR